MSKRAHTKSSGTAKKRVHEEENLRQMYADLNQSTIRLSQCSGTSARQALHGMNYLHKQANRPSVPKHAGQPLQNATQQRPQLVDSRNLQRHDSSELGVVIQLLQRLDIVARDSNKKVTKLLDHVLQKPESSSERPDCFPMKSMVQFNECGKKRSDKEKIIAYLSHLNRPTIRESIKRYFEAAFVKDEDISEHLTLKGEGGSRDGESPGSLLKSKFAKRCKAAIERGFPGFENDEFENGMRHELKAMKMRNTRTVAKRANNNSTVRDTPEEADTESDNTYIYEEGLDDDEGSYGIRISFGDDDQAAGIDSLQQNDVQTDVDGEERSSPFRPPWNPVFPNPY